MIGLKYFKNSSSTVFMCNYFRYKLVFYAHFHGKKKRIHHNQCKYGRGAARFVSIRSILFISGTNIRSSFETFGSCTRSFGTSAHFVFSTFFVYVRAHGFLPVIIIPSSDFARTKKKTHRREPRRKYHANATTENRG